MNSQHSLSRRQFVKTTTTALAVAGSLVDSRWNSAAAAATKKDGAAPRGLVDTNVTLGRWPFRRVPLDNTSALVAKLREQRVTQAWAGDFDSLFHKDLAAANARLAEECRRHGRGMLVPFGSVNPKLPEWQDDLRRCHEQHRMPGIRLHPNYHGYKLDDPAFVELLPAAHARGLIVQIVADMEDERTQHPLARVAHTDFKPLPGLLKAQSGGRVVLLNWWRSVNAPLVKQLADVGACFDIATLENVGGVANLIQQIPVERILFGSHAPLFYPESAVLKLQESALTADQSQAVRSENARRLLTPA